MMPHPVTRPASSSPQIRRRLLALLALGVIAAIPARPSAFQLSAAAPAVGPRAGDEVWLLDFRHGGSCSASGAGAELRVSRWKAGAGAAAWQTADWKSFLAGDDGRATFFWVHGNRVSAGQDRREGLVMYRNLVRHDRGGAPVRFVIVSWPSSQIRGAIKDVRIKAHRTNLVGWQLAWALSEVQPETPVRLIGFSYGARIITGALHVLSNRSLDGRQLSASVAPRPNSARVVLLAAAVHDYWLEPKQFHGGALSQCAALVSLRNGCDRALARYRWLDRCARACALGYSGVANRQALGPAGGRYRESDVGALVGSVHALDSYLYNERVMALAWKELMPEKSLPPVAQASKPAR